MKHRADITQHACWSEERTHHLWQRIWRIWIKATGGGGWVGRETETTSRSKASHWAQRSDRGRGSGCSQNNNNPWQTTADHCWWWQEKLLVCVIMAQTQAGHYSAPRLAAAYIKAGPNQEPGTRQRGRAVHRGQSWCSRVIAEANSFWFFLFHRFQAHNSQYTCMDSFNVKLSAYKVCVLPCL